MTNENIIQKINEWQECPFTMDLICPVEKKSISLGGIIVDGEVIMNCPSCGFTSKVPNAIFRDGRLDQVVS